MRRFRKWIAIIAAAVVAFIIGIIYGREEGKHEGRIEEKTKGDIEKVREAGKRGDTDTIDEIWRKKRP